MKLININGANATGKSTRVATLVDYLDNNYDVELVHRDCRNGYKEVGRIYGEYFVMGRPTKKGLWAGIDLADYSSIQSRYDLYKDIHESYPQVKYFIQEGYFNNTSKTTTKEVLKDYGVDSYSYYYILYDDIQDFINRCNGRTGQDRGEDWALESAGWKKNILYKDIYKIYNDLNEENCKAVLVDFESPKDYFVTEFFNTNHEKKEATLSLDEW